jgi:hypothetical protein
MSWRDPLAAIAREHLPAGMARRWIDLLRPAFALAADLDGPVIGRLGGLPMLPDRVAWPIWESLDGSPSIPLSYLAGIDCGAVPAQRLDIPLPATGGLHFFSHYECEEEGPGQHGGSRVLYVPAGVEVRERPVPPTPFPPLVYEPVDLRARLIGTAPAFNSAFLGAAFWRPEPDYDFGDGPYPNWIDRAASDLCKVFPDAFDDAVLKESRKSGHRLGGYAPPGQQAPENDLWPRADYPFRGDDADGGGVGPGRDDPAADSGRQPGRLLLCLDTLEPEFDDLRVHWVIRPDDLAALRLEAAAFCQTRSG